MAAIAKIEFCLSNSEFFTTANSNDMCILFENPMSNIFIGNSNTNTFIRVGNNQIEAGQTFIANSNIIMQNNSILYSDVNLQIQGSNGSLGIGVTPTYGLDILKHTRNTGNFYIRSVDTSNDYQFSIQSQSNHTNLSTYNESNWLMLQNHNGKVTVGLSNAPESTLEVLNNITIVDNDNKKFLIETSNGDTLMTTDGIHNCILLQNKGGKLGIGIDHEPHSYVEINGDVRINNPINSNEFCIISYNDIQLSSNMMLNGARIGINSDPQQDLHLKGDLRIENKLSNFYTDFTTSSSNITISTNTSSNYITFQHHGGSVNVGHNGKPEATMHIQGNMYITAGVISASDDRLKTQEAFITGATNTIRKLRPQTYMKGGKKESGLIAQEVFYDAPELRHLVHIPSDADIKVLESTYIPSSYNPSIDPSYSKWGTRPAGLNYEGLIAYLIKSIQEKDSQISDILARLDAKGI